MERIDQPSSMIPAEEQQIVDTLSRRREEIVGKFMRAHLATLEGHRELTEAEISRNMRRETPGGLHY